MLTTRDLATIIWLAVAAFAVIAVPRIRRWMWVKLRPSLAALKSWKVLVTFGALFVWAVVCVLIGHAVPMGGFDSLWTSALTASTVGIVILLGIPMVFRAARANSTTDIVRPLLLASLGITALLVFYINLEPFPLWAELLLQPVVTLISIRAAFAPETARRPFRIALSVFGIAAIGWSTFRLIADASTVDWVEFLREFLLTLWLPLLIFPFLWIAAFAMAFETAVTVRLRLRNVSPSLPVGLAVLIGLRFRIGLATRLNFTEQEVVNATTFREALVAMKSLRATDHAERRAAKIRTRNLSRYAGATGVDATGAQLDRREFAPTKRVLDWIATIEGGDIVREHRFSNVVADDLLRLENFGLRPPYGVVIETTADGQAWRAWRRTPSGWILGRGGSNAWRECYYAGAEPPTAWPGDEGGRWIERPDDIDGIAAPSDWAERDGTEDLY